MKEDELARWVDYARRVIPEHDSEELEERLRSGDPDAVETVRAFRALEEAAAMEGAPAGARALAKSLALVTASERRRAAGRPPALERLPFRVVFDSFATPLMAGQRSGESPSRELHLEADNLFVDVRVDRAQDARSAVVVGEVLEGQREPVRDVSVRVTAEGELLGETRSGTFGEFYLDLPYRRDMVLSMMLDECSFLSLHLGRPDAVVAPAEGV